MKVELEEGVWLADGKGDPPRTLNVNNAREFLRLHDAYEAIKEAKLDRPFPKAKVIP